MSKACALTARPPGYSDRYSARFNCPETKLRNSKRGALSLNMIITKPKIHSTTVAAGGPPPKKKLTFKTGGMDRCYLAARCSVQLALPFVARPTAGHSTSRFYEQVTASRGQPLPEGAEFTSPPSKREHRGQGRKPAAWHGGSGKDSEVSRPAPMVRRQATRLPPVEAPKRLGQHEFPQGDVLGT